MTLLSCPTGAWEIAASLRVFCRLVEPSPGMAPPCLQLQLSEATAPRVVPGSIPLSHFWPWSVENMQLPKKLLRDRVSMGNSVGGDSYVSNSMIMMTMIMTIMATMY